MEWRNVKEEFKYLFVSIDKFWEIKHNKDGKMIHLENKLDAWLTFMCTADPKDIWVIIEQYPEFKEIYKQVYRICQNMEDVMGLFSEELLELDRNTVEFMVDEMQRENDALRQELDQLKRMYEKLLQRVEE